MCHTGPASLTSPLGTPPGCRFVPSHCSTRVVSALLTGRKQAAGAPLAARRVAADPAGPPPPRLQAWLAAVLADPTADGVLRLLAGYSLARAGALPALHEAMARARR
jgi:hypothetical protein